MRHSYCKKGYLIEYSIRYDIIYISLVITKTFLKNGIPLKELPSLPNAKVRINPKINRRHLEK